MVGISGALPDGLTGEGARQPRAGIWHVRARSEVVRYRVIPGRPVGGRVWPCQGAQNRHSRASKSRCQSFSGIMGSAHARNHSPSNLQGSQLR